MRDIAAFRAAPFETDAMSAWCKRRTALGCSVDVRANDELWTGAESVVLERDSRYSGQESEISFWPTGLDRICPASIFLGECLES
jgi:hypothetical protein